jgi:hypothetical protein
MRSSRVQRGEGAHFAGGRKVELAGYSAQLGDIDISQDCGLLPRSRCVLRGIKGAKIALVPAESDLCPKAMS